MRNSKPTTPELLYLMRDLLLPMAAVERTVKLPGRARWESDADHSFQLTVLGCALGRQLDPDLDLGKVAQYAIAHDLVEAYAGDTTVWASSELHHSKQRREAAALHRIERQFGEAFPWIAQTIHAYEQLGESESRFVYALDKIAPSLTILGADHQPILADAERYGRVVEVARAKVGRYPGLLKYFEDFHALYNATPHFFPYETAVVTPEISSEARDALELFRDLILPMSAVERAMKLPHDLERYESDADHSFLLAAVACALAPRLDSELDVGLVCQYAAVHDLVEVFAGDTPVWASEQDLKAKPTREASALTQIQTRFGDKFPWIAETIQRYDQRFDAESRFVYALDKILPHAVVIIADHHPVRPTWERYKESEQVARDKVAAYPALLPYLDDLSDMFAERPHFFADRITK